MPLATAARIAARWRLRRSIDRKTMVADTARSRTRVAVNESEHQSIGHEGVEGTPRKV